MWSARKRSPDPPRPSERLRIPQPLIRTRLPSGRGATEQPNVTSDGDTALTPVFWMVLVATGIAAGLFGDLLMFVLFSVEHLAFGFNAGPLQDGVRHASDLRRLIILPLGGLIGGVSWYLLRRYTDGKSEIDDSIWNGDGKLSFGRSFGTSLISEFVIGMGASLGREAAP
jgi:CIC family chloride channel protein